MQINPTKIIEENILIPSQFTEIQQVGIDLTINETVAIPHGSSANVLLNEKVYLPEDVYSQFYHRSSFNRRGVLITGSIYDPGYEGQVGCTIYNLSGETITINQNERIGQMVFYSASPASKYNGQYQGEYLNK